MKALMRKKRNNNNIKQMLFWKINEISINLEILKTAKN